MVPFPSANNLYTKKRKSSGLPLFASAHPAGTCSGICLPQAPARAERMIQLERGARQVARVLEQGEQREKDRHRRQHDRHDRRQHAPHAVGQQRDRRPGGRPSAASARRERRGRARADGRNSTALGGVRAGQRQHRTPARAAASMSGTPRAAAEHERGRCARSRASAIGRGRATQVSAISSARSAAQAVSVSENDSCGMPLRRGAGERIERVVRGRPVCAAACSMSAGRRMKAGMDSLFRAQHSLGRRAVQRVQSRDRLRAAHGTTGMPSSRASAAVSIADALLCAPRPSDSGTARRCGLHRERLQHQDQGRARGSRRPRRG